MQGHLGRPVRAAHQVDTATGHHRLTWDECVALVGNQVDHALGSPAGPRAVVIAEVLPGECVLDQADDLQPHAVHPSELT